jgi:hypothetical protein
MFIDEAKKEEEKDYAYGIMRDPYKVAAEMGLNVVVPTQFELQLDIDSEEQYKDFLKNLISLINETKESFTFVEKYSKSGPPKRHITVTSKTEMGVWQRIALQFYLQSDPVREGINCKRVILGHPTPIVFFEKE